MNCLVHGLMTWWLHKTTQPLSLAMVDLCFGKAESHLPGNFAWARITSSAVSFSSSTAEAAPSRLAWEAPHTKPVLTACAGTWQVTVPRWAHGRVHQSGKEQLKIPIQFFVPAGWELNPQQNTSIPSLPSCSAELKLGFICSNDCQKLNENVDLASQTFEVGPEHPLNGEAWL